MENASKALLIVAGMLIGIMVFSIFAQIFRAGGQIGEQYIEKQTTEQLQLFNSQFEQFDKENNSINDMLTVSNLAIDINEKNEYQGPQTVEIEIKISGGTTLKVKKDQPLERNHIFKGSTAKYIYEFLEKNIGQLSISIPGSPSDDILTMVDEKMRYKYLFECTNIEYHPTTGKVHKMKFEMKKNGDYVEP